MSREDRNAAREAAAETTNEAVDFSSPESIAAELEANTAVTPAPKQKAAPKPKIVKVTCPNCNTEFDFEVPKSLGTRGALSGVALEDMTDDQLKIEYRNANSVAYKAKKANKNQDTITKSAERLERVKAAMEARGISTSSRGPVAVDAEAIAKLIIAGSVSAEDIQAFLSKASEATA